MEKIKHKACNNRVKLIIIPTYSITNPKVNSTLRITIQQIKKSRITIKTNGKN
jgi:hypothetical protein